jgi:maltose alpha-D-glucosyltransferase/alpha-amylase
MMADDNAVSVVAALAQLSSDALLHFLSRQRWFAEKGSSPASAHIVDAVAMPWGEGAFAIARVAVRTGEGEQLYQLPVALTDDAPAGAPESATIATITLASKQRILIDALYDPDFRRGLLSAVMIGTGAVNAHGLEWVATPASSKRAADFNRALAVDLTVASTRLSAAEQSNTSIIVEDRAILKTFRQLHPGIHPDVEVTEFLTARAAFAHTPALLGSLAFRDATDVNGVNGVTVAGMLQEYLPGSTDAWSYALQQSKAYFAAPKNADVANAFVADAKRLGATTRALHEALASVDDDPAFDVEPVSPEDVDTWALRTQHTIRESLALLERQLASPSVPRDRLAEAQALVGRGDHYLGRVNEIDDELSDDLGMRTRVHGDLHLGQVLRTRDGEFMIIDFEGEPSKPLEERREKTSPLRDVAGMLRSVGYAAATLAQSVEKTLDPGTRELRSARWERDVRAAFLAGYLGDPDERDDHPDVLPEDEANTRRLIALFEMEKAFYELAYELNNRPAWAWIPMRGISKLLVG